MTYTPLSITAQNRMSTQVSTTGQKGLNLEGLPEMMKLEYAKKIINYIPYSYGIGLRGGIEKIFESAGDEVITMLESWTDEYIIFGYGTTVARYNIPTDTITILKNDFSVNEGFGGLKYGDYFFVYNGYQGDRIHRMDLTTFTLVEVAAAPACDTLIAIGPRLYAGATDEGYELVKYSSIDDATNPPFTNWTVGTTATDAGEISFKNAGRVRSIAPLGPNIVVFSDNGYYAFTIDTIDSAGTLKKVDVTQDYTVDFGGARGAVTSPKGIFYLNEGGLWQLIQVGQTDVPYSEQKVLTSVLLSDEYFDNIDFSQTDIVWDDTRKLCLITYAQDSGTNNKILGYKDSEEIKGLFEIDGWSLNRFMTFGDSLYACSSVDGSVYKCFSGWNDDGLEIGATYTQELPLNSLMNKHTLLNFYSKGFLSVDTEVDINFDIYDRDGAPQSAKTIHRWSAQRNDNLQDGWGTANYGQSAWGGDYDLSAMVESFDGCNPRIRNVQRASVRFTSSNLEPHIINWFSADIKDGARIRRRKQTKIS